MTKHVCIESPDGDERQFIPSRGDKTLDGYEGWKVLGECSRAPKEDEEWAGSGLDVNAERRDARKRKAAAHDPMALLERIEALEARMAELDAAR